MPELPKYPREGEPISVAWGRQVVDVLRAQATYGDNKNIQAKRGVGGTVISLLPDFSTPNDFSGVLSNGNEFSDGTSGINVNITGGRVYGYYTTTILPNFTSTPANGVKDIWVEVAYDITSDSQCASFKVGTYPGFRSGTGTGGKNKLLNYLIGTLTEPTSGHFKWVQRASGAILVDTHVWPGEHLEQIARVQDEHTLFDVHFDSVDSTIVKHFRTTRYIKGLRTHLTISTATSPFVICSCSTIVTTTLPFLCNDPADISQLQLWLKADVGVFKDAGATLAGDGDTVQEWHDQSGNNNDFTQAAEAKKPEFKTSIVNGEPVVRFAAAPNFLDAGTKTPWRFLSDGGDWTAFFIYSTDQTANHVLFDTGCGTFTSKGMCATRNPDDQHSIQVRNGVVTLALFAITSALSNSTFLIITARHEAGKSGDDLQLFVDGVLDGGDEPSTTFVVGDPDFTAHIGVIANDEAGAPFDGDLAEMIMFDKDLDANENACVLNYLSAKYNITVP